MGHPDHTKNLVALRRIEGQVRGVQNMIVEKKYCVDIINQIQSVRQSLGAVQNKILESHLESCVKTAIKGESEADCFRKISELLQIIKKFRK